VYGFPFLDYQIAQLLENNQIHFTGAGSKSLEVSLHKGKAKEIMARHRMITPDYRITSEGMPIQIPEKLFPYIIKPIHEDGSIGITNQSIVHNQNELEQQVRKIHALYHEDALVEEYVTGRDISVSIIGSDLNRTVLPLSECVYLNPAKNQILTYDSKWLVDSPDYRNTEVFCPIELDPEMAQELERIALLAFEVMECKDYARIDFRVKGRTPYLLDVNPNPSIHPDDAGFTRSWKATGRNYDQLVMDILTSSIENSAIHQKVNTYENTNTQN
jgi:D-alanine-D-alanine ligase